MANIKISELNELLEGDRAYDDYLPIVDSSANETKKVSVKNLIPNNVELIAVTDTAPTSFGTGDKYYNTTTNRIYTARSGGWVNPEEPIKGILYVILEDQKTFTYDMYNQTLVSVGGGAGGAVTVYPDEPEEDTKLYIEEEDLDGQYLPVEEDVYSTTETKTNKIWIDGKSIYRKVITTVSPNQTTTAEQIGTIGAINTLVSIDANIDLGSDGLVPLPQAFSTNNMPYLYLQNKTNGNVILKIGNDVYKSKPVIVILEYTKTS